jgi:hypothetical protein
MPLPLHDIADHQIKVERTLEALFIYFIITQDLFLLYQMTIEKKEVVLRKKEGEDAWTSVDAFAPPPKTTTGNVFARIAMVPDDFEISC